MNHDPEEEPVQDEEVREHVRHAGKSRYSYVFLALLSVGLTIFGILYMNARTTHIVEANNHKFCQLIDASIPKTPPVKPADPKTHPAQQQLYVGYILVHNLGLQLGCVKK